MRTPLLLLALTLLLLPACVGKRKYTAAVADVHRLRSDSTSHEQRLRALQAQLYGLEENVQMTSEELQKREKELKQKDAEIKDKARRMDELDRRLRAQNDALNTLRGKVADALVNFPAEDLSVSLKDGKVYVSLSEKLLFPSGSDVLYPTGKAALAKLSEVLRNSTDINVMVEGHTDTVPIHTSKFKDNWDLSTAGATGIVRLLTSTYSVDPRRIQAAGRGEYQPVASNEDVVGRARNRRTEIILIPELKELYEMVGDVDRP